MSEQKRNFFSVFDFILLIILALVIIFTDIKYTLKDAFLSLVEPSQIESIRIDLAKIPNSENFMVDLNHSNLILAHLTHDPLFRISNSGEVLPGIAKEWQYDIKKDLVKIKIFKNVTFQGGTNLKVDHVIRSLQRFKASAEYSPFFKNILSSEKLNDYEFTIKIRGEVNSVIRSLSFLYPGLDIYGKNVGTGPYKVLFFQRNIRLVLSFNEDYWNKNKQSFPKEIQLIQKPDEVDRMNSLLNGESIAYFPFSADQIDKLNKNENLAVSGPRNRRSVFLHINQKKPLLRNQDVRDAINSAIDLEDLAILLGPYITPSGQLSPPEHNGHNNDIKYKRFDFELAKSLIKKYENQDLSLTITYLNDRFYKIEKVVNYIKEALQSIGFEITLNGYNSNDFWSHFKECNGDLIILGWFSDTMDSKDAFDSLIYSQKDNLKGRYNCGNFIDLDQDALIDKVTFEKDPAVRRQLLQSVGESMHKKSYIVPLYWESRRYVYDKKFDLDSKVNFLNLLNPINLKAD